jgi:hypothetical protein
MSSINQSNSNINFIDGQTSATKLLATVSFFQGKQGQFYVVKKASDEKGYKYTSQFPIQWALDHLEYTGPEECDCCRKQGTINGVFAFYCCNCQQDYEYTRGGSGEKLYFGYDISQEDLWSEFNYLNGVKFSEIGDEELGQNNNEPWHLDVQWAPSGEKIKSRYSPISATHRTDDQEQKQEQEQEQKQEQEGNESNYDASEYAWLRGEYEQDQQKQPDDPRFTGRAHANSWFINQESCSANKQQRQEEEEFVCPMTDLNGKPQFTSRTEMTLWWNSQGLPCPPDSVLIYDSESDRREAAIQELVEMTNSDEYKDPEGPLEQNNDNSSEERARSERRELERLQQECHNAMEERLLNYLGY